MNLVRVWAFREPTNVSLDHIAVKYLLHASLNIKMSRLICFVPSKAP